MAGLRGASALVMCGLRPYSFSGPNERPPTSLSCRCHRDPPELNGQENVWQFMRQNWCPAACSGASTISSVTAATPLKCTNRTALEDHVSRPSHLGLSSLRQSEDWYTPQNRSDEALSPPLQFACRGLSETDGRDIRRMPSGGQQHHNAARQPAERRTPQQRRWDHEDPWRRCHPSPARMTMGWPPGVTL